MNYCILPFDSGLYKKATVQYGEYVDCVPCLLKIKSHALLSLCAPFLPLNTCTCQVVEQPSLGGVSCYDSMQPDARSCFNFSWVAAAVISAHGCILNFLSCSRYNNLTFWVTAMSGSVMQLQLDSSLLRLGRVLWIAAAGYILSCIFNSSVIEMLLKCKVL